MRTINTLIFAILCFSGYSQYTTPPSWEFKIPIVDVNTEGLSIINKPKTDNIENLETDILRFADKYHLGKEIRDFSNPNLIGSGDFVFKWRITSVDAKSLNLELQSINLHADAQVFIYSEDHTQVYSRSAIEILRNTTFITDVIEDDVLILEIVSPDSSKMDLTINNINHDFMGMLGLEFGIFGNGGNCQVDVVCPEGNNWRKEINSACMLIINGSEACSGALINNTNEDGRPFILTANHCYAYHNTTEESLNSAISGTKFLFNYESPSCQGPDGNDNDIITGSALRARHASSDMILLEMNSFPPTEYYTYYSGWDRTTTQPNDGVGIHHPGGDVKKIATHNIMPANSNCFNASFTDANGNLIAFLANTDYWKINWMSTVTNHSVTTGGSSGSPLFNNNHRIIGQLFGSGTCNNPNCSDPTNDIANYGKVSSSWVGGGTSSTRLKDWLDPANLLTSEYFGLRLIRFYTVDHDSWFTGDVVKFHNVNVLPGYDVVVTELQDRFEASGTLDIPASVTFNAYP